MKRAFTLWQICAQYRLDFYLADIPQARHLARIIALHPSAYGKTPPPLALKNAIEKMGVLYIKLGQLLATRADMLPPIITDELALLTDKVTGFDSQIAKQIIDKSLADIGGLNAVDHFDDAPLASASIAQVHSATLDGKAVVVKVVRPHLRRQIVQEFTYLQKIAKYLMHLSKDLALARIDVVLDEYQDTLLDELDLTLESANAMRMRHNFAHSALLYVPKILHARPDVLVSERVYGVPIDQISTIDALGYDKARLSAMGLEIFFKQVFDDNFFHADMHAGNIWVETQPDGTPTPHPPRYLGLDCAIVGTLDFNSRLVVARLLLAVMRADFDKLADIMYQAGWLPATINSTSFAKKLRRVVAPMLGKPMHALDFAGILWAILALARQYQLQIPPNLVLLLKTLVHVEGLGRTLDPHLDIWSKARPIIERWLWQQLTPHTDKAQLAEFAFELYAHKALLTRALVASTQAPHKKSWGASNFMFIGVCIIIAMLLIF